MDVRLQPRALARGRAALAGATRALEDRLSDALHERLTQRFVEPGAGARRGRRARPRSRAPQTDDTHARALEDGPDDGPFAALRALGSLLPDATGDGDTTDGHALREHELHALVDAGHEAFTLDAAGLVRRRDDDRPLAWLTAGAHLLRPELRVRDELASAGGRARLHRRLHAWTIDAIGELLEPLRRPAPDDASPALRGLLYQLEQGLGCVGRASARAQLEHLTPRDHDELRARGVQLGLGWVYLPRLLRPTWVRRRFALALAHAGLTSPSRPRLTPPGPGAVSLVLPAGADGRVYERAGFPVVGPRAIRVDQLERARAALETRAQEPDALRRAISGWLGTPGAEADPILAALTASGRRRRRRRRA